MSFPHKKDWIYRNEKEEEMGDYINVKEIFGCDVFNDSVMQDRLPKKVYRELKKTIEEGKELSMEIADVVAHEMKDGLLRKVLLIIVTGFSR